MKEHDQIQTTLKQWSTALATAFNAAGFGCRWEGHTGSSSIRLGRLIVRKNDVDGDIKYHVDFERKLIVKKGERWLITRVEVYNPVGGLHVHISNFTDTMVAKIVGYAKQTIEAKLARNASDAAKEVRLQKGWEIHRREFKDFEMPDWVRVRPNIERDEDVGTFRAILSDHLLDWPLARITPAQAKSVIDTIRAVTCGQTPPASGWQPASVPVPPELQSTPMKVIMLLLAIEGREQPVRGYFMGGLVNEFYMEGSPSQWKPTHWMPMPDMPTTSSK